MAMCKISHHKVNEAEITVWHPNEDVESFSISMSSGGWLPGNFDSIESALMGAAACLEDEAKFVNEIQEPVNHYNRQNRLITVNDFKGKVEV